MIRKLNESISKSEIRDYKTFSLYENKVTILVGDEDGFDVERIIKVDGDFVSITDLLLTVTGYEHGEIPIRVEDFINIEFSRTSSRLRMDYRTASGVYKALVMILYENPCWMKKNNLKDYGIDLF